MNYYVYFELDSILITVNENLALQKKKLTIFPEAAFF